MQSIEKKLFFFFDSHAHINDWALEGHSIRTIRQNKPHRLRDKRQSWKLQLSLYTSDECVYDIFGSTWRSSDVLYMIYIYICSSCSVVDQLELYFYNRSNRGFMLLLILLNFEGDPWGYFFHVNGSFILFIWIHMKLWIMNGRLRLEEALKV